ncbi:MAG TPA: carbonic anhydrase [Micromonosporaceae bacterium]|nr:carbonic anhydrase [Micromonosporaceae bacterium]
MHAQPETPDEALAELLAGNARFVAGTPVHPNQDATHRTAVARLQRPFAVVFGCSDSRLAAEIIFDRGLGDLFVIRTAGHVIDSAVLATIEYGVAVLNVPLVVVLGHDSCGAIVATQQALAGAAASPGLGPIVDGVAPSVQAAAEAQIHNADDVAPVHVRRTMDRLVAALGTAVTAGRCRVVGMTYRLTDGRVTVLTTPAASPAPPAGSER